MSLISYVRSRLRGFLSIDELHEALMAGHPTMSGEYVSEESAQRLFAVYACVNVLAETLATLPPKLYRIGRDGGREVVRDHPFARALKQPNHLGTGFDFFELMVWHLALRGRFFAIKIKVRGEVRELIPIEDPSGVAVSVTDDYQYRFLIKGREYTMDDVLYIQMHNGRSIIRWQADTLGKNQSINRYGSSFFRNGAKPDVVIKKPGRFKDDAAFERFNKMWKDTYGGAEKSHKAAVLEDGMEVVVLPVNNEDSQFLDTNKYSDSQIAGLFRVPVYMIGNYDKATFSNIENLGAQFSRFTMAPWCRRVETALTAQCLEERGMYCEFLMDSLERGNLVDRYNAYRTGREAGILSANEIRQRENMDPYDGGDTYLMPMNQEPVGEEERDA